MDIMWVIENWPVMLLGLTSIVTGASILAKLTPTETDDAFIAKLLQLIDLLAINNKPTVKKPKKST
jgi:hypothetical protein